MRISIDSQVKTYRSMQEKIGQFKKNAHSFIQCSGTFRSVYEFEIEYEYDFSNLVLDWIITFHTNLVPIVSFSTGQQQEGVRALGT